MRRASEDRLLRQAREQFKRSEDYEGDFIKSFITDTMFANGDSDNNWQWPDDLWRNRQLAGRATLTINQIRTLNNNILNEMKKNPPGIIVRATGGKASVESAKACSGLMREITRRSRFANIVLRAARFQIDGGVGYWRVLTEWEPGAMHQRLKVASIKNMTSARIDCDAKEPDKSDAKWGFIFEDVLKEWVHKKWPKTRHMPLGSSTFYGDTTMAGWASESHYRMADWYNLEEEADELVLYVDPINNEVDTAFLSQIPNEPLNEGDGRSIRELVLDDPMTQRRKIMRPQMMWRKIIGGAILEETKWAGKYVPIIQVVGDEVEIDGQLDRKGNTRLLKDPQRMVNYWTSSATQSVALQTRTPWLVDLRSIEGFETYYASSNVVDHAFLPYRSRDSQGNELAAPKKIAPPEMSNAYLAGMQFSDRQLMTISGQREMNRDDQNDNLVSGRAIRQRKVNAETSTFGFRDNVDIAVEHTGRVLLDLMPHIYDTERVIRYKEDNGTDKEIRLDPRLPQAYAKRKMPGEENAEQVVFNPLIPAYDVDATAGPDFTTQREYAVEAMSTVVSTNKELWNVIGDLLVQNMDFPGAEEMAERLKRMIPKNLLGEGPDVPTQQLQLENQQLGKLIENYTALLAEANLKLKNKDEQLTIDVENALTKRIKEVGNAIADLKAVGLEGEGKKIIIQAVQEALSMSLPREVKQLENKETPQPDMDGVTPSAIVPAPGNPKPPPIEPPAQRQPTHPNGKIADDGHEYVEHEPGKFARVTPPEEMPQ